jgi:hypothetical protein
MRCMHAALVLLLLSALPACNKETPPTAEQPKAPDAEVRKNPAPGATLPGALVEASSGAPAPGPAAGSSRVNESQFELAIAASGAYQAGKEGTVEVVLDAKPPFHVNGDYPIKFKVKEGAGVKYPAAVVGKDKAKLEKQRATMPVAFVPESAGQHTVAGQFLFSVCTDENCLMDKRDLSLVVDVK